MRARDSCTVLLVTLGVTGSIVTLGATWTSPALAHASEGGFVLLLPTGHYRAAGVAAVITTLLLLALPSSGAAISRFWIGRRIGRLPSGRFAFWTSSASLLLASALVHAGLSGATDPLANPLGPALWVGWWIVLVLAQVLIGDLWRYLDPWRAPCILARRLLRARPFLRLPPAFGALPGLVLFLLFTLFMIGDPAPYDPRRLAVIIATYWLASLAGMLVFGRSAWLRQCEFVTIMMRRFAALAPLDLSGRILRIGPFGWQILEQFQARWEPLCRRILRPDQQQLQARRKLSLALFSLAMLGAGAFESLHTTFLWLGWIGVNPLEYPGRSALVLPTTIGLIVSVIVVTAAFAAAIAAGQMLAGNRERTGEAFRRQAQCTLPITAAYHFAHYLIALLVDGQHLLAALSDPYATGADLLALGHVHVTTGFLHTRQGMEAIWLTQAGAMVAGHVLAIVLSHGVALEISGSHRRALLSQLPISLFMIAYTMFGLQLLAAPSAV